MPVLTDPGNGPPEPGGGFPGSGGGGGVFGFSGSQPLQQALFSPETLSAIRRRIYGAPVTTSARPVSAVAESGYGSPQGVGTTGYSVTGGSSAGPSSGFIAANNYAKGRAQALMGRAIKKPENDIQAGYDSMLERLRQGAISDYGGAVQRNRLAAQLYGGGDPYLSAYGAIGGQLSAGTDLARNLTGAGLSVEEARQAAMDRLTMMRLQQMFNLQLLKAQQGQQGGGFFDTLLKGGSTAVGTGLGNKLVGLL